MSIENYLEQKPPLIRAVVGYLVDQEKVLLGLRKKVSLGLGENLIAGIGGKLEDDESYEEALRREIAEEINISIKTYRKCGHVVFLFPHKAQWNQEGDTFIIDSWEGEPAETEAIKPIWYPKRDLPSKQMWEDNRLWVPKILNGETINGIFLYDKNDHIVESVVKPF